MNDSSGTIRRSTIILVIALLVSLILNGYMLFANRQKTIELRSLEKQTLRWQENLFNGAYLYLHDDSIVCDFLTNSKILVKSIDVSIDDPALAAILESPQSEYFESGDYQGVRIWFTPKPSENIAAIMELLQSSPEHLGVHITEEDGYESWFMAIEFNREPPYATT